MKRRTWMFALLVLGLSSAAFADSPNTCGDVDLRSHFGDVWDQQNTGFCYAAAISDFLSFYTGERISAPDIAVINIERATGIERKLRKIILGKNRWSDGAMPGVTMDRVSHVGVCKFSGYLSENGRVLDFNEVNRRLLNETISYSDTCKPGQRSKKFKIDYDIQGPAVVDGTEEDLLPALDEALNQNHVAMMSYDVFYAFPGMRHGLHVSNIVGRRWNAHQNQCEYLIRNSWGKSFGENGYKWVSSKVVTRAGQSIYSLKSLKVSRWME